VGELTRLGGLELEVAAISLAELAPITLAELSAIS
jgi:hypothetical protein